jgi:nucleotide-binding universal stress UspA family protein
MGDLVVTGRILVALDAAAHVAVLAELGVRWARQLGAVLVGLAIVDEPGIRAIEPAKPVGGTLGVDPVYYMGYEARLAEVHKQCDQILERFAGQCAATGVTQTNVKSVGLPYERIADLAQSCDLVVLARDAHFKFTARDGGSEATLKKVLKQTPRPVVVVPGAPVPDGPILVAFDGSLQATRALSAFQATGLGEAREVHVICVDVRAAVATQHVEQGVKLLDEHGIKSIGHALESSVATATAILEQVGSLNAGLLVMGAYSKRVVREFFLGSVTRALLRKAPVPLFLFH